MRSGAPRVAARARVVLACDEPSGVDLALLEISDPRFDEHLPPVTFARVDRDSPAPVPGCWAVGLEDRRATRRRLRAAGAHGLATTVYTVNDPARMLELAALGVGLPELWRAGRST